VRADHKTVRRLREGLSRDLDENDGHRDGRALPDHIRDLDPGVCALPPVLNDLNYIIGAGADRQMSLGALLEVILMVANVGTAVMLYPLVKRQNDVVALGYVTARVVESTLIAVGIISILSIVTMRQDFAGAAGADTASLIKGGCAGRGLRSEASTDACRPTPTPSARGARSPYGRWTVPSRSRTGGQAPLSGWSG
jgi:hypothetical protein